MQAAKDGKWWWAKTKAAEHWCLLGEVGVEDYRKAMSYMDGRPEAQIKVLVRALGRTLQ